MIIRLLEGRDFAHLSGAHSDNESGPVLEGVKWMGQTYDDSIEIAFETEAQARSAHAQTGWPFSNVNGFLNKDDDIALEWPQPIGSCVPVMTPRDQMRFYGRWEIQSDADADVGDFPAQEPFALAQCNTPSKQIVAETEAYRKLWRNLTAALEAHILHLIHKDDDL